MVFGGSTPATTNLVINGNVTLPSKFSQLIGTLSGSGTVNVKSATAVQNSGTFAGTITGSGGLEVFGGTVVLSGVNTYTGDTSVEEGSLVLTGSASLTSSSMEVAKNTTLILDASLQNPSLSKVVIDGTATLKCSTATFVGYLVVDPDGGMSLSSTAMTVDGGAFSGPVSGNGSLTVAGSVVVDYSLSYSGTTTVSSGTLELDSPNSLASTTLNVFAGSTLFVNKYANFSASTNLTDNGTVNMTNASQAMSTLNGSGTMELNSGAMTINNGGTFPGSITGAGSVTVGGGTLSLSGPFSASAVTDNTGATLNLGTMITGKPSLVSDGATIFSANTGTTGPLAITLGSVQVGANGQISLESATSHSNRDVLVVSSIAFANTPTAPQGILNLYDNDMIVHNGSLSNLENEIAAGNNGGYWKGQGITSSTAATTTNATLAVELNNNGSGGKLMSSFDGQSVNITDVLIKYTYEGDADLSGTITSADYLLIDNGFNSGLSGWRNGDFNYDGVINGDDYALIDNAFNTQESVSFAGVGIPAEMIAMATEQVGSVPEPTSLGLLWIGGIAFLRQRRRRRS